MIEILRQSWIVDSIPWISDFRYWIPDPLPVDLGVRITIVSGIPDCLSCIPDSKAQGSLFHKQKFPGVRNADSLTRGDTKTCQLQTDGTLELFLLKEELLTVTNAFQKLNVHNNA